MGYIIICLLLIVSGVCINLVLGKTNKRSLLSEEPLAEVLKDNLPEEINNFSKIINELTDLINQKFQDLERKEQKLNELVLLADRKIKDLTFLEGESKIYSQEMVNERTDAVKIKEMRQDGLNSVQIAQNLGMGVGEVELHLGLLGTEVNQSMHYQDSNSRYNKFEKAG